MKLVKEKFPDSTIISHINKGINESCLFKLDDTKYFAKSFSTEYMSIDDYIASVQISRDYINDGEYLHIPPVSEIGVFENTAYVVYEYIQGNQLESQHFFEQSANASGYVRRIGKLLDEIHQQDNPTDDFGWYTLNEDRDISLKNGYDNATDMTMSYLNYNLDNIESDHFLNQYADKVRRIVRNNTDYSDSPRICHCDVKYNNIIETTKGTLYLIDWEFLRSADPMCDYVKTERQLLGRYSQNINDERRSQLREILCSSYFNPRQFDHNRYHAYWIQEMVECFRECPKWYPEEDVESVRSYYINKIDESIQELELNI